MRTTGIWLMIIGAIVLIAALGMDVSISTPYGRVANLSLMNAQSNFIFLSAIGIVVGVILYIKGKPDEKTTKARKRKSSEPLPYGIVEEDGLFLWSDKAFPTLDEAVAHVKQRLADHAVKSKSSLS